MSWLPYRAKVGEPTSDVEKQSNRQSTPNSFREASSPDIKSATGNLALQHLFQSKVRQPKLTISEPGDLDEQEANRVAEQIVSGFTETPQRKDAVLPEREEDEQLHAEEKLANSSPAPPSSRVAAQCGNGQPLPRSLRTFFEGRFRRDLTDVRIHTGERAAAAARSIQARAFTHGRDIVIGAGEYALENPEGRRLLAHELTHVLQPQPSGLSVLHRETAGDVKERHKDWGGLNLNEEALAAELVGMARAGRYGFVVEVINGLDSFDRDDVAGDMMGAFSITELIRMARNQSAVAMLRRMTEEIGDWSGWVTADESQQADLLGAVLNEPGDREVWNRKRIAALKGEAGTDLEALARMFEDEQIIDDGSVVSRVQAVLGVTESLVIPGLQTGEEFSDTGFRGDQEPGGAGFRDPHPSSRNQVGHFLTAVGLQFSPEVVSRHIPYFGTIRSMVEAPTTMSDAEVALRLTIGHEKAPDPSGMMAAINVLLTGVFADLGPAPEGETEEQHDKRVGQAVSEEIRRQIRAIISAFRTQFLATTDADIAAWNEALGALGDGTVADTSTAETPLSRISINPAGRGNSIQDLRLSLVGWRLGQLITNGAFADGKSVAAWIRRSLGTASP